MGVLIESPVMLLLVVWAVAARAEGINDKFKVIRAGDVSRDPRDRPDLFGKYKTLEVRFVVEFLYCR
ncbi:MAG: hypothetical protein ACK44L_03680 [Burkholderiales bacterium]